MYSQMLSASSWIVVWTLTNPWVGSLSFIYSASGCFRWRPPCIVRSFRMSTSLSPSVATLIFQLGIRWFVGYMYWWLLISTIQLASQDLSYLLEVFGSGSGLCASLWPLPLAYDGPIDLLSCLLPTPSLQSGSLTLSLHLLGYTYPVLMSAVDPGELDKWVNVSSCSLDVRGLSVRGLQMQWRKHTWRQEF